MRLISEICTTDLADQLVDKWESYELIEFILRIDLYVADLDFTKELRDKLTSRIEGEVK